MEDFRPSDGSVVLNLAAFWAGSFVSFPGRVLQFVSHSSLTLAVNLAVPETTAKKHLSLSAITENALVSVREV
jgi:hypothetical protein